MSRLQVHWVNQYAVPPDQPGGTRQFDMASELIRADVDCRVVASDLALAGTAYSRRLRSWSLRPVHEAVEGVPFTWLSAGTYAASDWRRVLSMLLFSAGVLAHLCAVPVRGRRVVFIGSSPHLFAATATWLAARLRRVPFVLEVRDLWPESYTGVSGRTGGPWVRGLRVLADSLYRRADALVLLAGPNRENVVAHGARPERVHVIPNGVDLGTFDVARVAPRDLHLDGHFTFVYAGAHGPANGLDLVVEACRLLAEWGEDLVRVVFLGDGPSKVDLRRQAAGAGLANVEFLDPVAKVDVPATLRSADAALMVLAPVELFATAVSPNKLFDYLACGLPVVTNVPGLVAGIVEEAGAGHVVAPGDAAALAEGMARLSRLDGAALSTLAGGRSHVAALYDRRVLATQLLCVLEGVASTRQ